MMPKMWGYVVEFIICLLLVVLALASFVKAGGQRDREAMVLGSVAGVTWLASSAVRVRSNLPRYPREDDEP
ncbi:MAG TPA: hypothetical protein VEL76_28175 [Gemmataceae bacterium]|nr:hypothetical protein [Gemmataceae bacterium]